MRRVGFVTIMGAVCVLVVGCSSDAKANYSSAPVVPASTTPSSTAAPSSGSASPTPTPTVITTGPNIRPGEKPPVLSALGKQHTQAGAAEFSIYWMQTLDWAYASTDPTLAKAAFSPACTSCAREMGSFTGLSPVGAHYIGERISFNRFAFAPNDGRSSAEFATDVAVSVTAGHFVSAAGTSSKAVAPTPNLIYRIWLVWQDSGWLVVDWKRGTQ